MCMYVWRGRWLSFISLQLTGSWPPLFLYHSITLTSPVILKDKFQLVTWFWNIPRRQTMKGMVILDVWIKYACLPPTPFLRVTTLYSLAEQRLCFEPSDPPASLHPHPAAAGIGLDPKTANLWSYQQPMAWFRECNSTRFKHYVYYLCSNSSSASY